MKASFIYVLSAMLLLLWIVEGKWREKAIAVFRSRLCLAFIAYYSVFLFAMLWTEDLATGWKMVARQTPLLLFPLFWSSAEPDYRERYISAFLAGVTVCAILAFYNWAQMHWLPDWPRGVRVLFKDPEDTAPFVDRIMYTPILALGAYFSLRRIVFSRNTRDHISALIITCLLVSNLAFSGGRAGMAMFAALTVALVFERIKNRGRAFLICVVLLPATFFTAYNTQNYFARRVDVAIADIKTFQQNPNSSFGQRIVYWTTSFRLFLQHPVLGVGSGDFNNEYKQMKPEYWKSTPDTNNPHNQFLLTASTTGLLGLTALFFIFYFAASSGVDMRTTSLLVGFTVVCMFESYLWRSNTALTFSVMLAVLVARHERGEQCTPEIRDFYSR